MNLSGASLLILALAVGFSFGWLLHRARVTSADVVCNQFRFRDFTVLKVMFTAIVVGGIGVLFLVHAGYAHYYIKPANLLGVGLGAALFGLGMVLYGYCPGTGLAALATGSLHALIGAFGMIVGAIIYALTFDWLNAHILNVWTYGKVRLPDVTGIPDAALFVLLAMGAVTAFYWIERKAGVRS